MTKRRGRKATGRKPASTPKRKADSAKPVAAKRAKSAPRSRRPVDPDADVFIPRSGVAPVVKTLTVDEDVFIPKPVAVQSDWVKDVGAPTGPVSDPGMWEPFAGVKPRAGSPVGWSRALLYAHGLELRKNRDGFDRVVCRYGCSGTTANVAGVSHHSHGCEYWTREGIKHAPF